MRRKQAEIVKTRVILHIDMDCFYVQVERGINPFLNGKPVAVSQYNPFGDLKSLKPLDNRTDVSNGSLIAVSYEARAAGVKRIMRGKEAKEVCPDLLLVQVPTDHCKADLTIYREAGAKVVLVLSKLIKSAVIEKASIDEVYLDVTEEALKRLAAIENDVEFFNALVTLARKSSLAGEDTEEMKMSKSALRVGHAGTKKVEDIEEGPNIRDWYDQPSFIWNQDDKLLLCGAIICDELRAEVLKQLGYSCSGGVSHNKMLSKIASAMHKPNRQTLVPTIAVKNIMDCLPVNRVAGFGGKLGDSLAEFGGRKVEKFSDLVEIGRIELAGTFGDECANWMINAANGIDHTPVEQRSEAKSIGCGKSYRQKNILPPIALQDGRVLHWLRELSTELEERVLADTYMHSRIPRQLTVGLSIAYVTPKENSTVDPTDLVKKWHESQGMSLSKVGPMCAGAVAISKAAHSMAIKAVNDKGLNKPWNITYISLSASGFVPLATESQAISSFFKTATSPLKDSIQLNGNVACSSDDICQLTQRIIHKTNSDNTVSEISNKILNHSADSSSALKFDSLHEMERCDHDAEEGEDDGDNCNTIGDIASFYNSHGKMTDSIMNKRSNGGSSSSERNIIISRNDGDSINQEKIHLTLSEPSNTTEIPAHFNPDCRQFDIIDNDNNDNNDNNNDKDVLEKDEIIDDDILNISREGVDMAVVPLFCCD
jgi:DNA polymerase eta